MQGVRFFCGNFNTMRLAKAVAMAGVFIVAFVFAGCGRAAAPAGVLRVGIGAEVATLDPALATGMAEGRVLGALYEGLVMPDGHGGVIAGVAQKWEVSDDGLTVTFHLRAAKWSDGTPITASDFVASWRRALAPELAAPNASMADAIAGARAFRKGEGPWENVGVEAADDRTLVVKLAAPSPTFLATLAGSSIFYPVPVAQIAKLGAPTSRGTRWTKAGLPTNGAFTLVSHRVNHKLVVAKNPRYWDAANVGLHGIEFYPIENRASEEMAFLSGTLDVTMALPLSKVSAYRAAHSPVLRIDGALQVEALLVNVRRPPLDKPEVRQALAQAIRRQVICDQVLRAGQAPAFNFIPTETAGGYTPTVKITEGSPSSYAWKALGERPLTYSFNSSDARKLVAETLQAQLAAAAGAPVLKLENLEWKTYLARRAAHDFDLTRIGWSADIDDPSSFLEIFVSDNPNNYTGWANAEFDTLVKARRFSEAEAILMRELPVIPLYFNPNVYLISPRVKGWIASPLDVRPWKNVRVE
jgi:oligopeptide transport system substrate-binding protein